MKAVVQRVASASVEVHTKNTTQLIFTHALILLKLKYKYIYTGGWAYSVSNRAWATCTCRCSWPWHSLWCWLYVCITFFLFLNLFVYKWMIYMFYFCRCRKVLNMRLFPNESTGKTWDLSVLALSFSFFLFWGCLVLIPCFFNFILVSSNVCLERSFFKNV
jgi:hypothetical protein